MVHCLKWKRTRSQYFEIGGILVRALSHSTTIALEIPITSSKKNWLACSMKQCHVVIPKQGLTSSALESEAI